MDKNLNYYENKIKYQNRCALNINHSLFEYLLKNKFLSEFSTEEEKLRVLENLGITLKLDYLRLLLNNKIDISTIINNYVSKIELIRRLSNINKDEKSKGYYSSYEEFILNNPTGSLGDWAIVNIDETWFIYKYSELELNWILSGIYEKSLDLSEYAKLSDLLLFQSLLISGTNIKTINGLSILGEGNIEISTPIENLSNYITKKELYNIQNPLTVDVLVSNPIREYTGTLQLVEINILAKKGGIPVHPNSITLSYKDNISSIPETTRIGISNKGITTFKVTCKYGEEEKLGQGLVNFVSPIYIGFSLSKTVETLNTSQFLKKIQDNVLMEESIQNITPESYLWIVTPYSIKSVATDPGFTYKVKMIKELYSNGIYYYRSNSAIDISHLTYYIK